MSLRHRLSPDFGFASSINVATLVIASLAMLCTSAIPAVAADQLQFENNFIVTGDYIVAGAYGMTNYSNGIATGKITVPDTNNRGIQGATYVPPGAQVVTAILYWATVEKSGSPGAGQNGYFRPVITNGGPPAPGYAISGVLLGQDNSVAFSNGGCSGSSDGKVTRVYRADVRGLLPVDASGNVISGTADNPQNYEVRLPSVGNQTPLTLGATLVIVYRVLDPQANPLVPLNAISIYDGAFGNTTQIQTPLSQVLKGFYQADGGTTRLTHIVASGQGNKYQTASISTSHKSLAMGSLYGNGQPLFPGWYGTWDNPTWTWKGNPNPILADDDSATVFVAQNSNNAGCVSWGAVIFSTTVKDPDKDGILPIWKANKGYTDVKTGQFVSLADPADQPAAGRKDMYIQLDHVMDDFAKSYAPDPAAVAMVKQAFLAKNIHLHINTRTPGYEIDEATCSDSGGKPTCAFPNQPGVTTWRGGFNFIKNELIDANGISCDQNNPAPGCAARFNPAQKDSFHYVVFGGLLGAASWTLADGSLFGMTASGTTVTFTTSLPHGMPSPKFADPTCPSNARVTVVDAVSNPNLNGTYCVDSILNANQFTIKIAKAAFATYTRLTDPSLAVANGYAGNRSGESDLGGAGSLVTLGGWGVDATSVNVQAGTLMHELGHSIGLPHGGAYYTAGSYVPTYGPNCKPNHQSVMNYNFQVDLLDTPAGSVLDFSDRELAPLDENSINNLTTLAKNGFPSPAYLTTRWYAPATAFETGTAAASFCDGTPFSAGNAPLMYLHEGSATNISWTDGKSVYNWKNGQDIDFNGKVDTGATKLRGFDDWGNIDLRQIGATGSVYTAGGGFPQGGGGFPQGGGGFPQGGGGFPQGGGGFPQGGGGFPQGGGPGRRDFTHDDANSVTRPPRQLAATEDFSPRTIHLSWLKPSFGSIGQYNIYRSDAGAAFTIIHSNDGTQLTYDDNAPCTTGGYKYFVTAVLAGTTQESVPSNAVSVPNGNDPLTACYSVSGFTALASAVHGSIVPVTWTVKDDFYSPAHAVTNLASTKTLVAIGPVSADNCATVTMGQTTLISNGVPTALGGASTFTVDANGKFTFNWDSDTAPFCAGTYTFALTLDSLQVPAPQPTVQLSIDVEDTDSTPHIDTVALPPGTVGLAYNNIVTEHGGTGPFSWSSTGTLPSNITLSLMTGTLAGTTCVAGNYNFRAIVTDARGNSGSEGLTLAIGKATTPTSVTSSANPSVFQQSVTFTITVAPQYTCTPTGTVTLFDNGVPIASNLALSGGTATFTTSALAVGNRPITASYSGDLNFYSSNSGTLSQTVNKASTSLSINSVTPSPAFVGQTITVSFNFTVLAPGAGSPIAPTGTITVTASDGSGCVAAAALGNTACPLSPAPTTAGNRTFTVTYSGDGNFLASGTNGNYTVYQLVFTTQPSNTVVGSAITPPVQVAAQDGSGNTLTAFAGSITLALGANPGSGTLSGMIPQSAVNGVATFPDLSINKMGIGYTLVASLTGIPTALTATSNPFNVDGVIYYVDQPGNFGKLDLTTGVVTQIASGTVPGNTGMDLTSDGKVYEYNISNQLFQINTATGAATQVGSGTTGSVPHPGFMTTGGLTTGAYYAIDMVNGNLYSIDLQTGVTTLVVSTGIATIGTNCGYNTSLAGSATLLYYTVAYTGTHCTSQQPDILYVINPSTMATTVVGPTSSTGFIGSAYVSGKLYGFTGDEKEYLIDVTTGQTTFVTNTTTTVFGGGSFF